MKENWRVFLAAFLAAIIIHILPFLFCHFRNAPQRQAEALKSPNAVKFRLLEFHSVPQSIDPIVREKSLHNSRSTEARRPPKSRGSGDKSRVEPRRTYLNLLPGPGLMMPSGTDSGSVDSVKPSNRYGKLDTGVKMAIGTVMGRFDLPLSLRAAVREGTADAEISIIPGTTEWRINRLSGDPYFRAALFETLVDAENYALLKDFLANDGLSRYHIILKFIKEYRFRTTDPKPEIRLEGNHLIFHQVALDKQFTADEPSDEELEAQREGERRAQFSMPTRKQIAVEGGIGYKPCGYHCKLAKDRDRMAKRKLSETPAFRRTMENIVIPEEIARRQGIRAKAGASN
jgi:hypothetical protein